jgi:hypothetical protein
MPVLDLLLLKTVRNKFIFLLKKKRHVLSNLPFFCSAGDGTQDLTLIPPLSYIPSLSKWLWVKIVPL